MDDVKRGNPEASAAGNLENSTELGESKSKVQDSKDDVVIIPTGKAEDKSVEGADHKDENEESTSKSEDLGTSAVQENIGTAPEPMEAT